MKFGRALGFSAFVALGMISAFGQGIFSTSGIDRRTAGDMICSTQGCQLSGSDLWAETRKPIVPMPTIASVLKTAKLVSLEGQPTGHYLRAAKAAGFESPATDEAKLLEAIQTHGLPIYDFAKVDRYLYNQALKMKAHTHWVWKPMRKEDRAATNAYGFTRWDADEKSILFPEVYAKAIPERVLEDIACLTTDAADLKLVFMVSDFEVLKPDPFLAVTTEKLLAAGKFYIVEQWDEPGFDDGRSPLVHVPQTVASR